MAHTPAGSAQRLTAVTATADGAIEAGSFFFFKPTSSDVSNQGIFKATAALRHAGVHPGLPGTFLAQSPRADPDPFLPSTGGDTKVSDLPKPMESTGRGPG